MSEIAINNKYRRKPSTAITLSIIMAGLGHIYCGRFVKGIILTFLSGLAIPVIFTPLLVQQRFAHITLMVLALLFSTIIGLIAIIDSWYTAKHSSHDYQLKDYNRWYVYLILIMMSTSSSVEIAFNVRENIMEAFRAVGMANYPTIVPNDRFLINKLKYKTSTPQRGDLAVYTNPKNKHNNIRRIVAIEGDTVEIKDSCLYINDHKLQTAPVPQNIIDQIKLKKENHPPQGQHLYETNGTARYKIFIADEAKQAKSIDMPKITIPKGHCFILSDNRTMKKDSRKFGPLPISMIKGKATFIYIPKGAARFGIIEN